MPQTAPKRRDSKCISGNGLKTDGGRFKAAQATIDNDEGRAKVQDDGNVFKTGETASNYLKTEVVNGENGGSIYATSAEPKRTAPIAAVRGDSVSRPGLGRPHVDAADARERNQSISMRRLFSAWV